MTSSDGAAACVPLHIDATRVQELIPHREPFLFVREATISAAGRIAGTCIWSPENPIFLGHFPGLPIVPGVLLVEAAAQLSGVYIGQMGSGTPGAATKVGVLTSIRRAMVHRPVGPGKPIEFKLEIDPPVGPMILVRGVAMLAGERAFSCEFGVAIAERSAMLANMERMV
jgi:3-hydroxyacyl-[acyl-carrier-protein] dehydratase